VSKTISLIETFQNVNTDVQPIIRIKLTNKRDPQKSLGTIEAGMHLLANVEEPPED
jgi:hypothetical protein